MMNTIFPNPPLNAPNNVQSINSPPVTPLLPPRRPAGGSYWSSWPAELEVWTNESATPAATAGRDELKSPTDLSLTPPTEVCGCRVVLLPVLLLVITAVTILPSGDLLGLGATLPPSRTQADREVTYCLDREILQSSQRSDRSMFQAVSSPSKEMIEQPRMAGLLPRPLPLSENMAASAALLARLTAARPAFPFPPSPFLSGGKTLPGMPPMLAQLPQFPDIRARLLGLQFPQRQESPPQFSPPGFLGGFNFSRDGSDSPVDGELFNILMS